LTTPSAGQSTLLDRHEYETHSPAPCRGSFGLLGLSGHGPTCTRQSLNSASQTCAYAYRAITASDVADGTGARSRTRSRSPPFSSGSTETW